MHLDIKPENFVYVPKKSGDNRNPDEASEVLKLIDFDGLGKNVETDRGSEPVSKNFFACRSELIPDRASWLPWSRKLTPNERADVRTPLRVGVTSFLYESPEIHHRQKVGWSRTNEQQGAGFIRPISSKGRSQFGQEH